MTSRLPPPPPSSGRGGPVSDHSIRLPGRTVRSAAVVHTLEEHVREAAILEGQAVRLEPGEMMRLRIVSE
ncbi:hypothetical protein PAE9249_01751 [Paenibacillus sp. CECT 9249]|uniref:hypothetical protein n=1 Tax=Paenibacillus sp. CECT 9249 TaxID=2845385 RepID=UPI001E39C5E6|nr:hypothetical protein [Paenibacillus sp. CECT 9249]CAH0119252.1 hypothetical protein PAE9249_01751 [Paenibacillus sp. CECT 9249]